VPTLPADLAACQPLLNRLLAKDPGQRFGSAREVLEALQHTALPGADAERAAEVVGRLRTALAEAQLVTGTPVFTASFGIADSTMTREREALIRLADEALYRSKQAGRDSCSVADAQQSGASSLRRERDQGAVVDITQVARST